MWHRPSSSAILIYSCVHNQIATFGLLSRQSVTLTIGCSHNWQSGHRVNVPSVKLWCDVDIAVFIIKSPQSVTLEIGLNIGCSHHRDNRPSEQSAKCTIGQALYSIRL